MSAKFICGCPIGENPRRDGIGPYCQIHQRRPYGWLSPQKRAPDGTMRLDYSEWGRMTSTAPWQEEEENRETSPQRSVSEILSDGEEEIFHA